MSDAEFVWLYTCAFCFAAGVTLGWVWSSDYHRQAKED